MKTPPAGLRWLVVACGVLSVAVLLGATIAGGLAYPGYDHTAQYISELAATGAPTQAMVSGAFVVSGGLLALFWLGLIAVLPRTALLIAGALFGAVNGVGLLLSGFYPCDFQCSHANPSASALLHDLFGGLGYLGGVVGLGLLALASRQWPMGRVLFPLGLICAFGAVVGFGGVIADGPSGGLSQRLLEIALALFTALTALAVALIRSEHS